MPIKPKLTVGGVPEHFNLPWHLAMESGAFANLGVDIEFKEYPGGTGAMTAAMSNGELDLALLLTEGAITNILRGHRNRIVKVFVDSPLIWGIHVSAQSEIERIEQIRDKVFAISRAGSGSHLIAIVDANERGWPIDDMKFSKVNNLTGALEKLDNGKVDVFLWERFTTQPYVDSGQLRRVGQRTPPWPAFVVSVREQVLEDHAGEIRAILERVNDSCAGLMNDPSAVELISKRYTLRTDETQEWFDLVKWNTDFDYSEKTFERVIRYLEKVKIVEPTDRKPSEIWFEL